MDAVSTRYGRDAYDTLRTVVADIKRDDPLAPLTVLVPTQLCGVNVRRTLAHGVAGNDGIAGLSVLTVDRLAEQLAAPALAGSGRRPAIGPVVAAAWRQALDEDPGVFAPVARHRATVQALVQAHRELREVDDAGLDAIAGSGEATSADLIRLHRRVVTILSGRWYDQVDLRDAATAALAATPGLADRLATPVLFLPQELTGSAAHLVRQLDEIAPAVAITGHTGDARADEGVADGLAALGVDTPAPVETAPVATRVFHASEADDEVRCIVRQVTEALRDTPAHRIAVLFSSAEPYARLLAEHLAAAGITSNGTAVRPTASRALARTLLDLLELPEHDWRRDEVLTFCTSAPVRDAAGQRVPAARWDRISRAAGVVAGTDWETRLAGYAENERSTARASEESDEPRKGLIESARRNADAADALRAFVTGLKDTLDEGASCTTWTEVAEWAGRTYRDLVGDVDDEPWLPEEEVRAATKVERVLAGLAGLATVEETADLTDLQHTLELELADDLPRHGSAGRGVLVGPLSAAIGLDADVVFAVGLAEDSAPGRVREDALLPDRVRELTGRQLRSARARLHREHRHLLAAFDSAPDIVASFPRGDLRHSTVRLPSRWLLPTLRAHAGNPALSASEWNAAGNGQLHGSPSFAAGLTGTGTLASDQEWRIRAAVAGQEIVRDDALRAALEMVRARAEAGLTRFDGDLSGHDLPHPGAPGRVVSPTSLESYAACPHAYFMERLLRVEPVESPETLLRISPLEIGNLIHDVLHRFFAHESEQGAVPGGPLPWTRQQRETLARITDEVAGEFEARGVTGHRVLWSQERTRIANQLQKLLDQDEKVRMENGRKQVRSELAFGKPGTEPVEVALPDGTSIRFRGAADRVDQAGEALVVVDYKSGSDRGYAGLGEDDPTRAGTKLQLPVYTLAARQALGDADTPVSAEYWFIRENKRIGLSLTDDVYRAHTEALAVLSAGIRDGLFPPRPPKDDGWTGFIECDYCDPDRMGTKALFARWTRKRADPRLADYIALVEPEEVPQS